MGSFHDIQERLRPALADRYRIEREIGRGGMAAVFLAQDIKHDRHVAVKVMDPELSASLGAERFLREIHISAKLNHPHILTLIDSGEVGGLLFYVMPFVEGESLRDRLDREIQLPLDETLQIIREVADGLQYAHGLGIVHRDIKPENILISGGHAILADFGIAQAVSLAGGSITQTGKSIGSPKYMSPEQASGKANLDGRSDLYSLGCMLYEMLAGEPPYWGKNMQALIAKHLLEPVPDVRVLRDTTPESVNVAIKRAMSKSTADRFRSVAEFVNALPASTAAPGGEASTESGALSPPGGPGKAGAGGPSQQKEKVSKPFTTLTRRPRLLALAGITALLASGYFVFNGAWDQPDINRIAVLPPENLTGDPDRDYFAAGIHEALVTVLGQILGEDVGVTGRRSTLQFRDGVQSIPEIARALEVDAVVETSILRTGDSALISARLTRAAAERQMWGETYGRDMRDITSLYEDVSRAIAREIKAAVVAQDTRSAGPSQLPALDPEAYDLYLRARSYQNPVLGIEPDLETAIRIFHESIGKDSTFAPAYAGMALAFAALGGSNLLSPDSAWPNMAWAAEKAVALSPASPEAQLASGVSSWYRWNWADAEEAIYRSLQLNPSNIDALCWQAVLLASVGREEEAVQLVQKASSLEPRDPHFQMKLVQPDLILGRWDEAIGRLQRMRTNWPESYQPHWGLAIAFTGNGDLENALASIEEAIGLMAPNALGDGYSVMGYLQGRLGQTQEARARLEALDRIRESGQYVSPVGRSMVHLGLGEVDEALDLLEEGYHTRAGWMQFAITAPFWAELHSNPRFLEIRRSVGLEVDPFYQAGTP